MITTFTPCVPMEMSHTHLNIWGKFFRWEKFFRWFQSCEGAKEGAASDAAHQDENDHDDKYEAQTAARIIAPAGAIRPSREQPEKHHDQNDEEDEAHTLCDRRLRGGENGRKVPQRSHRVEHHVQPIRALLHVGKLLEKLGA